MKQRIYIKEDELIKNYKIKIINLNFQYKNINKKKNLK